MGLNGDQVEVILHNPQEKKHSVRYDAQGADPAVTSVYVMKSALRAPWPKRIKVILEEAQEEV